MVTITRHQTRNIQAYHTKSNCKQIQVAGVEEITRRRSSQGCVSLARQEDGPGVTSLIASTVFSFVDRDSCLEETDPVLTQYKINRQILDLNGLPPGSPYVSSHDNQMPL